MQGGKNYKETEAINISQLRFSSCRVTWELSYQAACVWEWLLVTSVTVWPVQTDRLDYGSTAERLFLQ